MKGNKMQAGDEILLASSALRTCGDWLAVNVLFLPLLQKSDRERGSNF